MSHPLVPTAIYYGDDGFVESAPVVSKGRRRDAGGPVGRRVAGKEFLLAYLRYARTEPLYGLVRDRHQARSLAEFCADPKASPTPRTMHVLPMRNFHQVFFPKSPVGVIHYPSPLEARFAFARQYGGPTYALSGITHTISTVPVMRSFCNLVTAPYESFDRLICISRAAVATIRTVTDNYCAYLRDRFGGRPTLRPRLVNIPLGVDTEKFRPPTPAEREEERRKLGIEPDEMVILYVGRLIHFAKVHPFPIFQAALAAAKTTGKKVRIIMAGWSPQQRLHDFIRLGAQTFAPGVTTQFVDGRSDDIRYKVWWAADVFSFPTDNLQETFPQTVIEAMSCGLPVVAADWDGCRDQVVHRVTGFLTKTYSIAGATADATSKVIIEEYRNQEFLGRANQAVAVDLQQTAAAFTALINNAALRAQMGKAGRQRVLNEFTWEKVIRQYEEMWAEQEIERQEFVRASQGRQSTEIAAPAEYPSPEVSFQSYPATFIAPAFMVQSRADAPKRYDVCMRHPFTNYGLIWRVQDQNLVLRLLERARRPTSIGELESILLTAGVEQIVARATLIWLMKYAMLEPVPGREELI